MFEMTVIRKRIVLVSTVLVYLMVLLWRVDQYRGLLGASRPRRPGLSLLIVILSQLNHLMVSICIYH